MIVQRPLLILCKNSVIYHWLWSNVVSNTYLVIIECVRFSLALRSTGNNYFQQSLRVKLDSYMVAPQVHFPSIEGRVDTYLVRRDVPQKAWASTIFTRYEKINHEVSSGGEVLLSSLDQKGLEPPTNSLISCV